MKRKVVSLWCTAVIASLALALQARAESYPDRPLKIVVPSAAGSVLDLNIRKISEQLTQLLGQPVIIDNRPGAAGIVGTDFAAKSKPDGYTILLGSIGNICVNPLLYSKLPYDPARDFAPVTLGAAGTPILVVNNDLPVRTLKEFIGYAKSRPGQLTYGSPGVGTPSHLAMEMLKQLTGVELVHVPYKNSPQAVTDVIGGQVHATIEFAPVLSPHILTGKLRALAVLDSKRKPLLPDIPTAVEAGLSGFVMQGWYGYFVPKGTPREIVGRLNRDLGTALKSREFADWLSNFGSEAKPNSVEEFTEFIRSENERLRILVKAANIYLEQ